MKKVEESNYDSPGVIPNDDIMASGWRLSNEGKSVALSFCRRTRN